MSTSPTAPWPLPPSGALLEITGRAAPVGQVLHVALPTGEPIVYTWRLAAEIVGRAGPRGVQWETDPATEAPATVLRPHNEGWELVSLYAPPIRFGTAPGGVEVVRRVPPRSPLFLQVPARIEDVQNFGIGPGTEDNGIEPTSSLASSRTTTRSPSASVPASCHPPPASEVNRGSVSPLRPRQWMPSPGCFRESGFQEGAAPQLRPLLIATKQPSRWEERTSASHGTPRD